MSNHTYCYHLRHESSAHIDCVQSQCSGQDPYPVLRLGDATFWPSREQLVAIRDAIQGYLDAHPPIPPFTPEAEQIAAGIEAEKVADILKEEFTDAEVQEMF